MNLQILVVDDDDIVVLIHTTLIIKSGLGQPRSFSSGDEVMEYLQQNNNSTSEYLIFLDINMPGINGWEILDKLKEIKQKIYVVVVTSSVNKVDKDKAKVFKNIIAFLEKPMSKEDCDQIKSLPEISLRFNR